VRGRKGGAGRKITRENYERNSPKRRAGAVVGKQNEIENAGLQNVQMQNAGRPYEQSSRKERPRQRQCSRRQKSGIRERT